MLLAHTNYNYTASMDKTILRRVAGRNLWASATMHPSQSAINCCMMAGIDSFPEMATLAGSPRSQVRATPKNSHDSTFPGKAEHGSQPKTATQTDYPANPSTHRIRIRLRCRPLSEAKYGSRSEMAVDAGTDRHAGTQHHAMRYDSAYNTKAPRP